jgi:hypothetical protein
MRYSGVLLGGLAVNNGDEDSLAAVCDSPWSIALETRGISPLSERYPSSLVRLSGT